MSVDPNVINFRKIELIKRKNAYLELIGKHPNSIPVIVGRIDKKCPTISKFKFITSKTISFGELAIKIRNRIPNLRSDDALYFFISDNILMMPHVTVGQLYDRYKDVNDGFLYITYGVESVFGDDNILNS